MPSRLDYRDAAREHLQAAERSRASGNFVSAHYLFGLAVECILYAYGGVFDQGHNLQRQYRSSTYDSIVPDSDKQEISVAFSDVQVRWSSADRYESPSSLIRKLNVRGVSYNVKGDKLKLNCAQMSSAVKSLVDLGISSWT
jgi:hypothetical protein